MSIASNITTSDASDVCTAPALGALLPDYITDLLDDAQAEIIELHLVGCNHCKTRYLTVLRVRHEAQLRRRLKLPPDKPVIPAPVPDPAPTPAAKPDRKGQAKAKSSSAAN